MSALVRNLRVRSRQDSFAFQSCLQWPSDTLPSGVIEHCLRRATECVSADLERKGNLAAAYEAVGRSVCRNFDELSLEAVAILQPDAHEAAVARVGVSRIRIGLLCGSIGMEYEHMQREGRLRGPYDPGPDDRRRTAAARSVVTPCEP